ncbi:MAG: molybdopterin-binding protein, partial [Pseudomonadota bacterium]
TGDELVAAGEPVAAHQIRLSNGPAIEAALRARRVSDVASLHLNDEPDALRRHLADIVTAADITILSGGVSMGKADHVPAVLHDLGVREIFHRVSQRPGKPLWFGVSGNGALVFGLPGNPVSALVGFRRYVVPAIERMAGLAEVTQERVILATDMSFAPALTAFVPVTLSSGQGSAEALPVPFNTSGDFASLAGTDGFVELAKERSDFSRGEPVAFYRW